MSTAEAPTDGATDPIHLWPNLGYDDAPAAITFLTDVVGFVLTARFDEDDLVAHAQLRWPPGGGVMISSQASGSPEFADRPTGAGNIYLVTDDPDPIWARCDAAGATVVRPMREEDYGSRGFSIADPEGNYWSFGTYAGVA